MRKLLLIAALCVAPIAAHAHPFDRYTFAIDIDMSESGVIKAIGSPTYISVRTCGANIGEPWSCKLYAYISNRQYLHIFFQNVNGVWVVNSWTIG